jgi:hypothetical protein
MPNRLNRHCLGLLTLCFLTVYGCATFKPLPIDQASFRDRAQTQVKSKIRVTAAVLSDEESQAVFDLPLYKQGIQPVWLEIENDTEKTVWFNPAGLDPDYFAPLEVAYMNRVTFSGETNKKMNEYFHAHAMEKPIPPGVINSGFVFTHLDMGTKAFNVDVIGEDSALRTFTFFIPVPGLRLSHQDIDWEGLYKEEELLRMEDEEGLRKALESLPCCPTVKDGKQKGGPLNIVFVGTGEDLYLVLIRSGWNETAKMGTGAASETTGSQRFAGAYRYAPVTPLFLYGRPQDAAFRKTRGTRDERNQIRLWLSPILFRGKPVWVGQISREIKVRYRFKLEPLVDEARTYLFQDVLYSSALEKYGYVKGVGAATQSNPRKTLQGNSYFTDGYRAVMWVTGNLTSFSDIEFLSWETPGSKGDDD